MWVEVDSLLEIFYWCIQWRPKCIQCRESKLMVGWHYEPVAPKHTCPSGLSHSHYCSQLTINFTPFIPVFTFNLSYASTFSRCAPWCTGTTRGTPGLSAEPSSFASLLSDTSHSSGANPYPCFHYHFHFHLTEVKCNHFQQHYIHHFTFISTFICPFTFNFTWLSWAAIIFNNIASTTSLSFCSRKLDLQRTVDKFKLDFYSPSPSLARDINLRYWIWRADYFQHFSWSVGRKDGWDQSANQISQSFTNLLFFILCE